MRWVYYIFCWALYSVMSAALFPAAYGWCRPFTVLISVITAARISARRTFFRTVGPKTAVLVLIADAFKGILAVGIMSYLFHNPLLDVITALGALLGHNYSLFLGFKGGKGVATALGLLIFMMPKVALSSFGIWLVCVLLTRYVSLGSIMAAIFTPPLAWYLGYPSAYVIFSMVAAFFVVLRHKENIHRLLTGTESKIKPAMPRICRNKISLLR